ncbi:MAG: hypothetical protein ABJB16_05345, partial [Saprospiraceae bacterium]
MKNVFIKCSIILIFLSFYTTSIQAQACKDASVNLDSDGHYTLKAKDIILPLYLSEPNISFSPMQFTCDDIGVNDVNVLIYTSVETFIHCQSKVTVNDVTPPTAKCFSGLHVVLDGKGQYEFKPQGINLQSSDACSEVGFRFIPSRVRCTDPNPINVMMIARDNALTPELLGKM